MLSTTLAHHQACETNAKIRDQTLGAGTGHTSSDHPLASTGAAAAEAHLPATTDEQGQALAQAQHKQREFLELERQEDPFLTLPLPSLTTKQLPTKKRKRKSYPSFSEMFYQLMLFRCKEEHLKVPSNTDLGAWVSLCRKCYAERQRTGAPNSYLTEERIGVLNSIGFTWSLLQSINDQRWERNFALLQQFQKEHSHCLVPQNERSGLGNWVKMQREQYQEQKSREAGKKAKRPNISTDRIDRLDALGFVWRAKPAAIGWDGRFAELLEYRRVHGHCNVPQGWKENEPLGRWVMKQVRPI